MSPEKQDEDTIFNTARRIESRTDQDAYLSQACEGNVALRQNIEKRLTAVALSSQLPGEPTWNLGLAKVTAAYDMNQAAPPQGRQALTSSETEPVVLGDPQQSILQRIGQTIDMPRVSLRDAKEAAADPITRPNSPEMPAVSAGGRYRLDGEIARGGMGAILKGRDTDLGRDLAVKVLLDVHRDKPQVIQRFVEEAQIGGQLQHPGIPPVYELGQFDDNRPFFSMKLVKGETLSKLLADRKDSGDERGKLLGIFEQICQTMAYAHSRGVIHRDLKPANVMVGAFGEVQVMDWGLAKVLPVGGVADEKKSRDLRHGQSIIQTLRTIGSDIPGKFGSSGSHTEMGSVMGTPAYMPPEQALGEIDNLDERADVFGLGAILCEILTGDPPYTGDDGGHIFRLASRGKLDPCFARLAHCGADEELIALTKHCLELEPAARPRDAGALAERMTGYLESVESKLRETELRRVAEAARVEEERKRRRVSLALAVSLLMVMVAGTAAASYFAVAARTNARQTRAALVQVEEEKQRAEKNAMLAELRLKQAQLRAYSDQITRVGQSWQTSPSQALDWLEDESSCPHDLREFVWNYFYCRLKPDALELSGHEGLVTTVHFAPNGAQIATGGFDHAIRLWDPETGRQIHALRGHTGPVTSVKFSPDSRFVASASHDASVRIWDAESGSSFRTLLGHDGGIGAVDFSPDGTMVASAGSDTMVKLWDVETGDEVKTFAGHTDWVWCVAFSPDGATLATGGRDGRVLLWDIETGKLKREFGHGGEAFSVAFSPDGSLLAVTGFNSVIRLWDLMSNSEKWSVGPDKSDPISVAFSPDGRSIASANADHSVRLWDAETGRELDVLPAHTAAVKAVAYSPDGKTLVSASDDQRVKVLSLSAAAQSDFFLALDAIGPIRQVEYSPDGRTLAIIVEGSPLIHLRDAETSWPEMTLQGSGHSVVQVAFSHDGRWLASTDGRDIKLWDLKNGREVRSQPSGDDPIDVLAFSPDDRLLATAGGQQFLGATITIRETRSLAEQQRIEVRSRDDLTSLAFSPDGKYLAVGGFFDYDGQISNAIILNVADWKILHSLSGHQGWISHLVYSPDGDTLVTCGYDSVVCLWDAVTGELRDKLVGHSGAVMAAAFSPDGRTLATGSEDRNIRFWDPRTGKHWASLVGGPGRHDETVTSLSFSPDGRSLVSAASDGTVFLWEASRVDPEIVSRRELLSLAREVARESVSKKEAMGKVRSDKNLSGQALAEASRLIEMEWEGLSLPPWDWTPPKNPNPQVILDEARADTRAGRYENALRKHVWFHENAVAIEPSLSGVRLSFALSDWPELAERYPPALAKLKEVRDEAKASVLAGTNIWESFHDMESINDHLDEHSETKAVFEALDEKDPKIAKRVFDLAQPSLIKGKAYVLAGKYISPNADFAWIKERYRRAKERSNDPRFDAKHLDFANKRFANDTTTLVAILAVNDRKDEAEEIAASARAEWADESFHAALEKALTGVVPDPWP